MNVERFVRAGGMEFEKAGGMKVKAQAKQVVPEKTELRKDCQIDSVAVLQEAVQGRGWYPVDNP
ncbi:hypothetical protein PG996_001503 [Apiospora saccharicola]|uniref:Uncharacterized protein n=1 Tax=Apiospora saccharicola TaxID=335842 RepID=A0ABR1WGX6_9PEZI